MKNDHLVSQEHAMTVCKMGKGSECCRYLLAGPQGLECGKLTIAKSVLDAQSAEMIAQGDNCEGV